MGSKVYDILRDKGDFVLTVSPDTPARKAIQKMVNHNVGSVVVTEVGTLKGIFTERDFLRRITLQDDVPEHIQVQEVMTSNLTVVEPNYDAEECLEIITEEKIRHLPVVEENNADHLIGIISIGDCVKRLSEHRKSRIRNLNRYITGDYHGTQQGPDTSQMERPV